MRDALMSGHSSSVAWITGPKQSTFEPFGAHGEVQDILDKALDLATAPYAAYLNASPQIRRLWNHALFERFLIIDGEVEDAGLAEPFKTLLDPNLLDQLEAPEGEAGQDESPSPAQGSKERLLASRGDRI